MTANSKIWYKKYMTKRNFLAGKTFILTKHQANIVGLKPGEKVTFPNKIKINSWKYIDFDYDFWYNVLYKNSNKKGSTMTKLSAIMKTVLDKDLRAMQKLGYLDGSLEVTEEGMQWLAAQYVKLNKAELGKVAQEELKDRKKSKKCKSSDSCEDED